MKRVSRWDALALAVTLGLGAGGCRDTDGGGGGGGGSDPDAGGDSVEPVSIQDVQGDTVSAGDEVALREVVVVAVDTFGGSQGAVHVMEPEGGPHSGVAIFSSESEASGIAQGDLIDVEGGVKEEFAFDADDSGRSLTQLVAPEGDELELTSVGEGQVPEPEVLDPAELAADDEEAERWEGVLIEFQDVAVESAPETITDDDTFQEMRVTGSFRVVSDLAPLSEEISAGDCYASITGIVSYAFNYQLFHTSEQALVADQEACPALADPVTVREAKGGDVEEGDAVVFDDVVVTGIESGNEHFYVQDKLEASEQFNGIYVYRGSDADPLPEELAVGSVVDVNGDLGSFAGATQVVAPAVPQVEEGVTADPVVESEPPALSVLASIEDGVPYEHVLIEVANVELTQGPGDFGSIRVSDGDTELIVDDPILGQDFFETYFNDNNVEVGDCFASLRGVMDRTEFDDTPERRLYPRSEDDIALEGDCTSQ